MKWMEVIQVRTVGGNRKRLESQLRKLIDEVGKDGKIEAIKSYTRVLIDSDFSVQLLHDSKAVRQSGSRLGQCLASALKAFGLVNHSVWAEMKKE
jgi:hypothetical protein